MAYDVKAFYKENKLPEEQQEYIASEKFVDKDGHPIPWTIRAISADQDQALKEKFTSVTTDRRTGMRSESFDQNSYVIGLAVRGVVAPDLTDKGLQKSYGVTNSFKLIQKMLSAGELQKLALRVVEISGLDDVDTQDSELEFDYMEAKKN